MAIKNWHVGKLVLLWLWGAMVIGFSLQALEEMSEEKFIFGSMLIGVVVGTPLVLSVITWKWLSGKEPDQARKS